VVKVKLALFALSLVVAGGFMISLSGLRAGEMPNELKVGGFLIGPQAYSFNHFSFFEAVEKAKQVGANVIEAYPGQRLSPEDKSPFNHQASAAVWAKARIKLEQVGIRLMNYGVVPLGKTEAETRQVFDFAKVMGIPTITSEPVDGSFDLIERLVKEYNIKVAVHNHPKQPNNPGYKYWDPQYVLSCVKGRDPRMGSAADTGHWVRSGIKPIDAVKLLEGRIISCHLKDLNEFGPNAHDVPYGQGVSDIKLVLDELRRQRFNGNISIEYEYNWDNSVPEIRQCIDFVREYGRTAW
jgi:sugar phosphate isomerase/epimerase